MTCSDICGYSFIAIFVPGDGAYGMDATESWAEEGEESHARESQQEFDDDKAYTLNQRWSDMFGGTGVDVTVDGG